MVVPNTLGSTFDSGDGFKNLIEFNEKQMQSFDDEFNKIFNNM